MPQGWNEKMKDIRSAARIVEDMQLQWRQDMVEFRLALRDLEDVQKRDGRSISSALKFFKEIEHHDRDAPKQTKINPSIGHAQQQSSLGLGQPVSQPVAPGPQPAPYASPYVDIPVDGLVISPYSHLEPLYSLAHIIGQVILSAPNQRMTTDHIYHWIRGSFGFHRQKGGKLKASISTNLSSTSAFERMPQIASEEGNPQHYGGVYGSKRRIASHWKVRPDCVAKFTEIVWPIDLRQGPIMEMSRNGHVQRGYGGGGVRARQLDENGTDDHASSSSYTETVWPMDLRKGPIMVMSRNGRLQRGYGRGGIRATRLDHIGTDDHASSS